MEIKVPSLLRIKPHAIFKLGKYLRQEGYTNITLCWGEGIRDLFKQTVEISFASSEINVVFEEDILNNDINDAFSLSKKLPYTTEAVVSIGGGKAIDFCKYISFIKQLPHVAVPTLVSNDAFASPISSLVVDGKRQSIKTEIPHGVIIDTEIIAKAPKHFLYSGIGDLFCKTTSVFDWKLSYKKTGEYVNDFAAVVASNAAETFSYYTPKDLNDLQFIGIIASSLLMSGIAMIIAGNSRPASGSEHLISHAYDKVASKPSLHGLQVGVASYAVSYLQEETYERVKKDILESGFFNYMQANPLNKDDFINAVTHASDIKQNFYTILSEKNSITKLEEFINTDELMSKMLE